jgi:hypothetical protein
MKTDDEDPLFLAEWPTKLWERSFTYNMPFPPQINTARGGTIVYLVQNCVRVEDNLALQAASWLSVRLGIPMVAMVRLVVLHHCCCRKFSVATDHSIQCAGVIGGRDFARH